MTDAQFKKHVGKLCLDKDNLNVYYMVYAHYNKLKPEGGIMPYYKYICMNSGFMSEAPCSHFFDSGAYVRFLSPSDF